MKKNQFVFHANFVIAVHMLSKKPKKNQQQSKVDLMESKIKLEVLTTTREYFGNILDSTDKEITVFYDQYSNFGMGQKEC